MVVGKTLDVKVPLPCIREALQQCLPLTAGRFIPMLLGREPHNTTVPSVSPPRAPQPAVGRHELLCPRLLDVVHLGDGFRLLGLRRAALRQRYPSSPTVGPERGPKRGRTGSPLVVRVLFPTEFRPVLRQEAGRRCVYAIDLLAKPHRLH